MKARKSKIGKALCPVETIIYWVCVREKQVSLGTGHSYQEDRNSAQDPTVLRRRILNAACVAYKARMQEIKLFQGFCPDYKTLIIISSGW